MRTSLKDRVKALESAGGGLSGLAIVEHMEAAARRWRAMTPEEQRAERLATVRHALESPPPDHPILRRMWASHRRLARLGYYERPNTEIPKASRVDGSTEGAE